MGGSKKLEFLPLQNNQGVDMVFWKTKKLAEDIRDDAIPVTDWRNYYIVVSIIGILSINLVELEPRSNFDSMWIEFIATIVVLVIGIHITFMTNLSKDGGVNDFIGRAVALSVPLSIKIILLSVLFGISIAIINEFYEVSSILESWLTTIFSIFIQVLFFWRLNIHLHNINITTSNAVFNE